MNHSLLELYGRAQECTPGEFIEEAMGIMQRVLPFDSGAAVRAEFSDQGEMRVHAMHAYRQPVEKLHDRASLSTPDPALAEAFGRRGRSISFDFSHIDRRKHPDLIAYVRKYQVAQSLVYIPATPLAQGLGVLALWRAQRDRPYSAADVALADQLMPHLFQARQINDRLQGGGRRDGGALLLVTDRQGCLQFLDDEAGHMLQAEWPAWTPPMLPPVLFRALSTSRNGSYTGRTLCARIHPQGKHLHIMLEPVTHRALLTPAELSVAELAAAGASYKEVAADLGISPATVRNQLHKVYAKLQISNKTALIAALNAIAR
ncbi:helix-turn-helix transcriptional regulator [Duganella sp. sic0402]|uniref:helix-turn-helix transcriptional regulator n=1 Tax=Duganella sp. sic0402 TaxID=2854786 RepID=UPI001C44BB91|nr:helix-turn-helix transcriptional regulator [Duganella sp. sic0402]MBV7536588.1 helix-turn-helix transcriptional regulator [Duganella sp. sic0402]